MPQPTIDPTSLTIEERLLLIDELWLSIAKDAKRRLDAFKRNPSRGVRWEDLRAELNRKYG